MIKSYIIYDEDLHPTYWITIDCTNYKTNLNALKYNRFFERYEIDNTIVIPPGKEYDAKFIAVLDRMKELTEKYRCFIGTLCKDGSISIEPEKRH